MKYLLCKKKDGCRLVDVDISLREAGKVIDIDDNKFVGSKSVRAAINAGWIEEITKKEFEKILRNNEKKLNLKEGIEVIDLDA